LTVSLEEPFFYGSQLKKSYFSKNRISIEQLHLEANKMEKQNIDEQTLKELQQEHQEFLEQIKITNEKLDKIIQIMEESQAKPTDTVM
jgi:mevalonate kinase